MILYLTGLMDQQDSIYDSTEHETRIMGMYNDLMKDWPVPYETRNIDTKFGTVHVNISCPEEAPPALLLPGFTSAVCVQHSDYAKDPFQAQPFFTDRIMPVCLQKLAVVPAENGPAER